MLFLKAAVVEWLESTPEADRERSSAGNPRDLSSGQGAERIGRTSVGVFPFFLCRQKGGGHGGCLEYAKLLQAPFPGERFFPS